MIKVLLLLITPLPYLINATLSMGRCEHVEFIRDFDVSRYLGVWYEQMRDVNIAFEKNGKCLHVEYSNNTTPDGFSIIKA